MDSKLGESLQCKKDNRQEALDHDEHAVGVYKFESDDAETMLVGHVPIELSMLLSRFLKASEKNAVEVKVCGKRRREVGLVIPGHYRTYSNALCNQLKMNRISCGYRFARTVTEKNINFVFILRLV